MKKFVKFLVAATAFVVLSGMMSSCNKTVTQQVVYVAGWTVDGFKNIEDMGIAQDYLVANGALDINDHKTYSVTSKKGEEDCLAQADALAKADFEKAISGLNVEELQSKMSIGSHFEYYWTRTDIDDAVGKWECPAVTIPEVFGTLTFNGVTESVVKAKKTIVNQSVNLHLISDNMTYSITVPSADGSIPTGSFDVDGSNTIGYVKVKGEDRYSTIGTSCSIEKNGFYYSFKSSGVVSNTIQLELNCEEVVF